MYGYGHIKHGINHWDAGTLYSSRWSVLSTMGTTKDISNASFMMSRWTFSKIAR